MNIGDRIVDDDGQVDGVIETITRDEFGEPVAFVVRKDDGTLVTIETADIEFAEPVRVH